MLAQAPGESTSHGTRGINSDDDVHGAAILEHLASSIKAFFQDQLAHEKPGEGDLRRDRFYKAVLAGGRNCKFSVKKGCLLI